MRTATPHRAHASRFTRSALNIVVALSVLSGNSAAIAGSPAARGLHARLAQPDAAVPVGATLEELYQRGQEHFDAGEYTAAAKDWANALHMIEEDAATHATRSMILVNAMTALIEAFRDSREALYLRRAHELLDDYIRSLAGREPSEAVASARARLLELLDEFAETQPSPGESPPRETPPPTETKPTELSPPPPAVHISSGTGFIASGVTTLSLGLLGGSSLLAVGIVLAKTAGEEHAAAAAANDESGKTAADAKGLRGDMLQVAGGISLGVLLATGIGLLIAGTKLHKRAAARQAQLERPMALYSTKTRSGIRVFGLSGRF